MLKASFGQFVLMNVSWIYYFFKLLYSFFVFSKWLTSAIWKSILLTFKAVKKNLFTISFILYLYIILPNIVSFWNKHWFSFICICIHQGFTLCIFFFFFTKRLESLMNCWSLKSFDFFLSSHDIIFHHD